MKQKLILLICIITILLSACGKNHPTNEINQQGTNAPEEEVTVLNAQELILAMDSPISLNDCALKILGWKIYSSLENDSYTDTAEEGNEFLVLFLELRNKSEENLYFTPEGLSACVDGETIDHTFLVNEPEGYSTIFQNVAPQSLQTGFIVWEVPKDWEKFSLRYEGWKHDGVIIQSYITPDGLFDPE